MKGKTLSGFEYEILEEALDDMELLECLQQIDENGKFWSVGKCLDILFGKDQKDAYYKYLREKDGRVRISVVTEDLSSIFAGDELKN